MKDYFAKAMRIALALCLAVSMTPTVAVADEVPATTDIEGSVSANDPPAASLEESSTDAVEGGETQSDNTEVSAEVASIEAADADANSISLMSADEGDSLSLMDADETSFSGGSGTQGDPYLISTAEDMWELSAQSQTNNFESVYFKLTADINLACSEAKPWVPISQAGGNYYFKGIFDGDNHIISGLYYKGKSEYAALFGRVYNATIKNFVVQGEVIGSGSWAAGVAALVTGTTTISGVGSEVDINTTGTAGGIVGRLESGTYPATSNPTIDSCWNLGSIAAYRGGGIVGANDSGNFRFYISNCYNAGTISRSSIGNYLAGIIGYITSKNSNERAQITNCYTTGAVETGIAIAGYGQNLTKVSNCYYLDTYTSAGVSAVSSDVSKVSALGASEMRSSSFANTLGDAYVAIDGDYPILSSQLPFFGAPSFSTQPQNASYMVGEEAADLNVSAKRPTVGDGVEGTLSYQWYTCVDAAGNDASAIEGETYTSYAPSTEQNGVYYYFCEATNTFMRDGLEVSYTKKSDVASITVSTQTPAATPVIIAQPLGTSGSYGQTSDELAVAANVAGEGAGVLSYQWYCSSSADGADASAVEGATNASYMPDSSILGTSYYYCEVTNNYQGSTTSASVKSDTVAVEIKDVVEIATAKDLLQISENSANGLRYEGVTIKLTSDIDLSSVCGSDLGNWKPIGQDKAGYEFMGTFDGGYHTVSGLYIAGDATSNDLNYSALFGYAENATIENLVVEGSTTGWYYAAGILGYGCGVTLKNLHNAANVNFGGYHVGGIVGRLIDSADNASSIENCVNTGALVSASSNTYSQYVGGIVGSIQQKIDGGGKVVNCYNLGNVTAHESKFLYVGGIAGYAEYAVSVSGCYNAGKINVATSANKNKADVFVGYKYGDTTFSNCYYISDDTADIANNYETTIVSVTDAQKADFAAKLGSAYKLAAASTPRLVWQEICEGAALISAQPEGATYKVGDKTAALVIEAQVPNAKANLSYQWYVATKSDLSDAKAVANATSASYVPSSVEAGAYYYYCVVTNTLDAASYDMQSETALVAITSSTAAATPVITTQPKSQEIDYGGKAQELSVEASATGAGAGILSCQWYVSDEDSFDSANAIKGATKRTYTPDIAIGETKYYYCVVTNTFEGVKTATATSTAAQVHLSNVLTISTAEAFVEFGKKVVDGNNYAGIEVRLTSDIDLSQALSETGWSATKGSFCGTFNGCGHTISGFTSTTSGLFYNLGKNACVENFIIKGSISSAMSSLTNLGVIASCTTDSSYSKTVRNVGSEVDITVNTASYSTLHIAGIVAYENYAKDAQSALVIENCYNKGNISVTYSNSSWRTLYCAGILAEGPYNPYTQAKNCYNAGDISISNISSGSVYEGGIAGYRVKVTNCYNTGNITCSMTNKAQGISTTNQSSVENSYYLAGCANATSYVGGTSLAKEDMQGSSLVDKLGDAFSAMDGAYPTLSWEGVCVSIAQQPQNALYTKGESASALSVVASIPESPAKGSDGKLSYQWYKASGSVAAPDTDTALEGADKASYTPTVSDIGTASYYCVVTNTYTGGADKIISNLATVTVMEGTPAKPNISTQPQDASYVQTGQAELSIEAALGTGEQGTLTYQWYKASSATDEGEAIAGATAKSFVANDRSLGDTYYYCVVSNTISGVAKESVKSTYAKVAVSAIEIDSATGLAELSSKAQAGETFADCDILLTSDIDLSEVCGPEKGNWTPINYSSTFPTSNSSSDIATRAKIAFQGHFNGQGHTIKNLYISGNTNGSLFGIVQDATIENFVLTGSISTGSCSSAAVIYRAFDNVEICNVGTQVDVTTQGEAAGIAFVYGPNSKVSIEGCYNAGNIKGSSAYGIAHTPYSAAVALKNCYNTGSLSATYNTSGIFYALGGTNTVENCYNAGQLSSTNGINYIVGIANASNASVSGCYSTYVSTSEADSVVLISKSDLDSDELVSGLGSAYMRGMTRPVLSWEIDEGHALITAQPADAAYVQGERADAFSVSAALPEEGRGADGVLSYQWYSATKADLSDAVAIEGAQSSTYSFETYNMAPDTYYLYCEVTNTFNGKKATINSRVARLDITSTIEAKKPVFTVQPVSAYYDTTNYVPTARTLKVAVGQTEGTGYGEISYQWYRGATSNVVDASPIAGATDTSYTPALTSDCVYYFCVATNTFEGTKQASSASDAACIICYNTASCAPSLTSQSSGTVRYVQNDTADALNVEVSMPDAMPGSAGTLSYQWYRNTTGGTSADDVKVANATSESYVPDTSLSPDVYYYYCKVTNTYLADSTKTAEVVSTPVCVELISGTDILVPAVTTNGVNATYDQGDTATELSVSATCEGEGAGVLSYQWYVSDTESTTDGAEIEGATKAAYTPSTLGDAGTKYYYCKVTNTFEKVLSASAVSTPVSVTLMSKLHIYTVQDMRDFATEVNNGNTFEGYTVELENDIDLEGNATNQWSPIGKRYSAQFKGTFEGNGHTISGLYIEKSGTIDINSSAVALFGGIYSATIKNLVVQGSVSLTNSNYSSDIFVAGVAAYAYGSHFENVGSEVSVHFDNKYTYRRYTSSYVGGIVGQAAGPWSGAGYTVVNCYNTGSVQTSASDYRQNSYLGGIAGQLSFCTLVENCYNTGVVAGGNYIGGLAGYATQQCTFKNNYSTGVITPGTVFSSKYPGALLGCAENNLPPTYVNNYYLNSAYSASCANAEDRTQNKALSAADMRAESFMSLLNSDAYVYDANGYPRLIWQNVDKGAAAPVITTQPENGTYAAQGAQATALSVEAELPQDASGTLSYQWYENTVAKAFGGTAIKDATSASYAPSTKEVGMRYYYCVVTNTASGKTAENVSNVVYFQTTSSTEAALPSFPTQPVVASYGIGTTTDKVQDLTVKAFADDVAGVGELSYQWYSNTENSYEGATAISGATKADYKPSVANPGTLYYFCEVTNTFENVKVAKAQSDIAAVTVTNKLEISDAEGLAAFATAVNSGTTFAGCEVLLTADIDLSSVCSAEKGSWTPIGNSTYKFEGTFDGKGHKITNLYIDSTSSNQGLFGYVYGTSNTNLALLKNFTVSGSLKTTFGSSAGIAAYALYTSFENVGNEVDVVVGRSYVGGIVGNASFCSFDNCYNKGKIEASGSTSNIAGLAGMVSPISGTTKTFTNCYNLGTVTNKTTNSNAYTGGLCTTSYYAVYAVNCYTTAAVTADKGYVNVFIQPQNNNASYVKATNSYVLDTVAPSGYSPAIGVTLNSDTDMKDAAFVSALAGTGSAAYKASTGTYPVLLWENATYMDGFTIDAIAEQSWTGSEIKPSVVVCDAKGAVVDASNYNVAYANNVNTGEATVTVTGTGAIYTGTLNASFKIVGTDISGATIDSIPAQVYTGFPAVPSVNVKLGETTLVDGTDISVEYSNNVNAGRATVTVTGLGKYSGSASANFDIVGTEAVPVEISSAEQLLAISKAVNAGASGEGITFKLMCDIDLSSVCSATKGSWTPIGTSTNTFDGTFDGQGYTISGLYINEPDTDRQALFGTTNKGAVIKNFVLSRDNGAQVIGKQYAAGVVGSANLTTIENVRNEVSVSGSKGIIGGIAGRARGTSATNTTTIRNCVNTASVTDRTQGSSGLGGIVGYTYGWATVESCYNCGAVSNNKATAGIVGSSYNSRNGCVTINNCYNVGATSSYEDAYTPCGILCEAMTSGGGYVPTLTNSYYLDTSADADNAGAVSKSADDMKAADFVGTLNGDEGSAYVATSEGYPRLYWEAGTPITHASVSAIADQAYTGSAIEPAPEVKIGDTALFKDVDYTVAYANNTDAGKASVTITGKGSYYGTLETSFNITGTALDASGVSGLEATYAYAGKAIEPALVVKSGQTTLTKDTDYTLAYTNNTNVGTATVAITGKGGYTGSIEKTFEIAALALNDETIKAASIDAQTYTGQAVEPQVTLTLGEGEGAYTLVSGTDYTVSYKDNTAEGQATATITGMGNFTATREVKFTIQRMNLADATIALEASYPYTGSSVEPKPVVTLGGKTLAEGSDYTLSYKDNVAISATAPTVIVKAADGSVYTGEGSKSFAIDEADFAEVVTIEPIADQSWTGSALKPVPVIKVNGIEVDASKFAVEYSNNTGVGKATVSVSAIPNTGYGEGTKEVEFNIVPQDFSETAKVNVTAPENSVYTGSAINPSAVSVTLGATTLVENTDYTYVVSNNTNVGQATVTVTGKGNYTGTLTGNFTIKQASLAGAEVTVAPATYTGESLYPVVTVKFGDVVVPASAYSLAYASNTNAGDGKVTITALEGGNFTASTQVSATFKIAKAAQAAPHGIARVNESVAGMADGALYNLTDAMEYRLAGADKWISVAEGTTSVTGLSAGTYEVRYTETANYAAGEVANYKLVAVAEAVYNMEASVSEVALESATYGYSQAPSSDVTLSNKGNMALSGVSVKSSNDNIKAELDSNSIAVDGTAKLSVSAVTGLAKGTYEAELEISAKELSEPVKVKVSFEVTSASIENAKVSVADAQVYAGRALEPKVTVELDGVALGDGDFSVAYADNTYAGKATVTVTGTGNYAGTATGTFEIAKAKLTITAQDTSKAFGATEPVLSFKTTGNASGDTVSDVTLMRTPGEMSGNYVIKAFGGKVTNANKVDVTSSYDITYVDGKFVIDAAPLSVADATITVAPQTYTGKALTPEVKVVLGGKTLSAASDYEVAYADNVNAGTATVTVTGKGSYIGTAKVTFAIAKVKLAISAANAEKAYGAADPALVFTSTGLLEGDKLEGVSVVRAAGEVAGTYAINVFGGKVTSAAGTDVTANYDITYTAATFTVGEQIKDEAWTRLAGDNRYATNEKIVESGFAKGETDTVILATGENFPDALAASALAGVYNAPVVLTSSAALSDEAASEISRLAPSTVYVVGGTAAVSDEVVASVEKLGVATVKRLSGQSRTETALKIYEQGKGSWGKTALVASGNGFADALSASSWAYAEKYPIFLASNGTLDDDAIAAIKAGGFERVIILGGTAGVDKSVESAFGTGIKVERLAGANRFETSAAIANAAVADSDAISYDNPVVATGASFADALGAGALAGKRGSVLLLASEDSTGTYCATNVVAKNAWAIGKGTFVGGTSALSESLAAIFEQASIG